VAKDPGGAQAVARLADELNRQGNKWEYSISDPTKSSSGHTRERYAFIWKSSKFTVSSGRPFLVRDLEQIIEREPFVIQLKQRKNSKALTLVNYHACTHKKNNPERIEIVAISNWLISKSYENVIWAGDMNLKIDDEAFNTIKRAGYTSVLNGEKTSLKMKCKNGEYLSRAEDNMFYKLCDLEFIGGKVVDFISTGNCDDVIWKRNSYSDHLGIEIKLQL